MRAIIGYDPDVESRSTAIVVIATPAGGPATDITSIVKAAVVTDTLERSPSTARLTLARQPEAWGDPNTDPASPLAIGARLSITMGETGGTPTQIFDGEIMSGGTGTDAPLARTNVLAVGGARSWWRRRITSGIYANTDSDLIVTDLFETWGELTAPGDFDLPGAGRNLSHLQVLEQPIMEIAHDIYGPTEAVPWWDPVQEKLSTLPGDIPVAEDLTLPETLRGNLDLSWVQPKGTRVSVQAGTQRDIVRVEIGPWTTPLNFDPLGGDIREEGVRWASGSKGDLADDVYWAHDDGTGKHYGIYDPGPPDKDFLWVHLIKEYHSWSGPFPGGARGYAGPEGVRFIQNDPLISTDPVSALRFQEPGGGLGAAALDLSHINIEEWVPALNKYIATVNIVIDPDEGPLIPPPAGYTPDAYWDIWRGASDFPLNFDLIGRQMETGSLEQYFAQAWDDDLIAAHGDSSFEVRNETLLEQTNPLVAVEAEAVRQMALVKVEQAPATLARKGQDLRLLPGDCIRTPHPRDAADVLIWAQQVTHTWQAQGARGGTEIAGYVVGTV